MMTERSPQPSPNDAVLGGHSQSTFPINAAVLGGVAGRQRILLDI